MKNIEYPSIRRLSADEVLHMVFSDRRHEPRLYSFAVDLREAFQSLPQEYSIEEALFQVASEHNIVLEPEEAEKILDLLAMCQWETPQSAFSVH